MGELGSLREPFNATGYQTQALGAVFVAGFEEELESDANAEQRQVEISQ